MGRTSEVADMVSNDNLNMIIKELRELSREAFSTSIEYQFYISKGLDTAIAVVEKYIVEPS